jgi:hypothetical protein
MRFFLTVEEFRRLPEEGTIDPFRIRFSQARISCVFRKTMQCIICSARELILSQVSNFPAINIVEFEGRIYTLDNRRLWVHQKAGLPVRYKKSVVSDQDLKKFREVTEGISVEITFTLIKDNLKNKR